MEDSSQCINTRASDMEKAVLDNAHDTWIQKDQEDPDNHEIANIDWIPCKDFTINLGSKQIEEYISTWELHPSWLFSLKFLEEKELEFHKQYHYKSQWSIPTARTPIPKATACVYFIIQISKIKPPTLPVEVYFQVESCRLTHRPGKTRFREKWLRDVIESKTLLRDTVDF